MDKFEKEILSEKEYASRRERGERARKLRKALKLTRDYFKKKYNLPTSTLQSWEDVNFGGMVESGAQRLAHIYESEGITVTPEWLMYGTGNNPLDSLKIDNHVIKRIFTNLQISPEIQEIEKNTLNQELKVFYELHKKAVHLIIEDDAMSPWLMPGDCVGGKWYFDDEVEQAVGFPCIIQTETGEKLIRLLRSGNKAHHYTLTCTNPQAKSAAPILSEIKLLAAAPIIRVWKPKPTGKF